MNVEDRMGIVENENVNGIFMHWSPEEIKFYSHLMLQQIDAQNISDEEHKIEYDM